MQSYGKLRHWLGGGVCLAQPCGGFSEYPCGPSACCSLSWCIALLPRQVCTAFCTVLASVLARMPSATLRSKFSIAAAVLCTVLEQHRDDVRAVHAFGSSHTVANHDF